MLFYKLLKCSQSQNQFTIKQQQIGIHDCGVFSVAFAFEVCAGNDVEKMHFEHFSWKHLCDCFSKGKMTSFPQQVKAQPVHFSVRKVERVACKNSSVRA